MKERSLLTHLAGMNYYYRFYPIDFFFQSLVDNDLKNFELWLATQHFSVDNHSYQDTKKFGKKIRDYNLNLVCLTPEQSNPKPYSLTASDPFLRKKALDYYKNVIRVSSELSVPIVSLNCGWVYYNESVKEAWKRSVEMVQQLAIFSENYHVDLVIEALQPNESPLVNSIEDLRQYISDIAAENVAINLDLGAMARQGETIQEYFDCFGSKVKHCHFVDGAPTGHLAWGDGERNAKDDLSVFEKNEYSGYFSFEFAQSSYFKHPNLVDKRVLQLLRT